MHLVPTLAQLAKEIGYDYKPKTENTVVGPKAILNPVFPLKSD